MYVVYMQPDCNGNGVRSCHIPLFGAPKGKYVSETTKIAIFSDI